MASFRNLSVWRFALVMALCVSPLTGHAQNAETLSQVKKVYVGSIGEGESAAEVRDHLVQRLEKSREIQVLQKPDGADAIVKGTAQIWATGYISPTPRSHAISEAVFAGFLSVELTGKNNQTLWSYLVTPSSFPLHGVTDDLARQLAERLLEDIRAKGQQPLSTAGETGTKGALRGAGATFPAPLYQKWFASFGDRHPDLSVRYEPVGSAEGIQRLLGGSVDFGASDMPLSDDEMAKAQLRLLQIPVALGAVVPIYHLAPLERELRFTPAILAGIYLGKIKKWNDPEIRNANRGTALPDAEIKVIHRSDGSGTTYVWSDYLSKVSAEWKTSVGAGLIVPWPVGLSAAYNEGVASAVQATPNSIGYVEFIYAIQHQLGFAAVQNAAGHFVKAELATISAAVRADADSSRDLRVSLTNASGGTAYPIVSYTWMLLPEKIENADGKSGLLELARWMLTSGQKSCAALGYAPLPANTAKQALDSLNTIH